MRQIMSRRRGAGMTEYVILVGMIALGLTAIAEKFKEQIRITIVGNKGITSAIDKHVDGPMGGGGGGSGGNSGGSPKPGAPPSTSQ